MFNMRPYYHHVTLDTPYETITVLKVVLDRARKAHKSVQVLAGEPECPREKFQLRHITEVSNLVSVKRDIIRGAPAPAIRGAGDSVPSQFELLSDPRGIQRCRTTCTRVGTVRQQARRGVVAHHQPSIAPSLTSNNGDTKK